MVNSYMTFDISVDVVVSSYEMMLWVLRKNTSGVVEMTRRPLSVV